jgi:carboxymethylenebutenolidase
MCFELDSAPPIPVIAGAAVSHEELVLTAADGNRFAAFLALPEEQPAAAVVIYPDVRGLYRFYEELALRFAERGYAAIAFDYFGRTLGPGTRDDDFEYLPHVEQTTDEGVQADARAAVARLRETGAAAIASVGFCFGGRASWVGAASGHGLAAAVGFYGSPTRERGGPSVIARVGEIACPILALQAGDDRSIPAEDNAAFERALAEAGVEHELVVYDGAPHSFFDRKQEEFQEASDDAWRRTLELVARIVA